VVRKGLRGPSSSSQGKQWAVPEEVWDPPMLRDSEPPGPYITRSAAAYPEPMNVFFASELVKAVKIRTVEACTLRPRAGLLPPAPKGLVAEIDELEVCRVLRLLEREDILVSRRAAVQGSGICRGATFGKQGPYVHLPEAAGELCTALNHMLETTLQKKAVSFSWTSVQVNRGTIASEHRDSNNLGLSAFVLLGNFSGGEFVLRGRSLAARGLTSRGTS